MSSPIERVRYYEGEYLRSADFDAEQAYHIEMRRRMNHALHLHGIVYGLELTEVDEGAGIKSYNIGKGLAVDYEGREIFLFAARQIDQSDLQRNLVTTGGEYEVWLQYEKDPDVPPSAGYGLCNESGQYTRWAENAAVVIVEKGSKGKSWRPTDPVPDDNGLPGVMLGTISVDSSLNITKVTPPLHPEYVGLRAQRIKAPVNPVAFSIADQNSALNPPVSLGIEPNVFAEKNLVVGDDFPLPGVGKFIPPPPGFPSPRGNVKIAQDLFLQGDLYSFLKGDWLSLGAYIGKFIPDIQVKPVDITTNKANDVATVNFDTTVANVGTVDVAVSVSNMRWSADIDTVISNVAKLKSKDLITLSASAALQGGSTWKVSIAWSTAEITVGANQIRALEQVTVSCVVVFHPQV